MADFLQRSMKFGSPLVNDRTTAVYALFWKHTLAIMIRPSIIDVSVSSEATRDSGDFTPIHVF